MLHERIEVNEQGSSGAYLTTYFIEGNCEIPAKKRPVVLICPGGAYSFVSKREGEPVALRFVAEGYHAAVLDYSVYPTATFPTALLELGMAVSMLRDRAEEWFIDTDRIILMGFSAGGHLVASYSCFWSTDPVFEQLNVERALLRPNGLILGYPVITPGYSLGSSFQNLLGDRYDELIDRVTLENQVNTDNPPTFLWHTATDSLILVENSKLFAKALADKGIPAELHIYPEGMHGLALANHVTAVAPAQIVPCCQCWVDEAQKWIAETI